MARDVWELSDLATPWCVHIAATLGVAEAIEAGKGSIGEIAAACGADAAYLSRVLRQLARHGVFEETQPGHFALNDEARGLLSEGAKLGLNLDGFGGRMANAWSTMLAAVRTGQPAYHQEFGRPFWDDLAAHPEIAAEFDALMGAGHGRPSADVLVTGGWERVRTVVDVGGGTGWQLAEILKAQPHLTGTLVDLPSPVAQSAALFQREGVADRARAVAQSFFDPLPAGADLYIVKSVLNDWPEPERIAILRRCVEACPVGGRIVIMGGISPGEAAPDLLMLVLVGGGNWSLPEFETIASGLGLRVSGTGQPTGHRFLVECEKTASA